MKIIQYQAKLNSERIIDESTIEGCELSWNTLHWSLMPNKVKRNTVSIEESDEWLLLQADIAMELQSFTETMCFTEKNPLSIELEAKADSTILAYYYFKDWWTRPAFVSSFDQVPDETSILFYQSNEEYHFLLALPGKVFRAHFEGKEGCKNINLVLSADSSGYTEIHETAMLAVHDKDPYLCMEKGMEYAACLYNIPLREDRTYPSLFEKIGWCSWDAFYKDVNEEGLVAKAKEIHDKKIPFGWMIIDDGWQDYKNDRMISYGTNKEKFPGGLASVTSKIKEICGIDQIGVWHAFNGYWCGIDPEGSLYKEHPERFIFSHQGKVLPKPECAYEFYGDWYKYLTSQGIRFVKVDSQSSTRQHYRTNTPIGQTSAFLHKGLDLATKEYFNEGLINCMGMSMEDVLQRPISGISRNSDDFFPSLEESFKEHLLENAYNTLWHNIIYYGDWDMFWSTHPCAQKHALLRALSAGPVYVSDRVGETVADVLKPLCYEDGTLLRANTAALPAVDCLLNDPEKTGYLKLINHYNNVHYLAIYSYSEKAMDVTVKMDELNINSSDPFVVYDVLNNTGWMADDKWTCALEENGYAFYQIAPVINEIALFGRKDKYLSSHAIMDRMDLDKKCIFHISETGPVLFYTRLNPCCSVNGQPAEIISIQNNFWLLNMPVETEEAEIIISLD